VDPPTDGIDAMYDLLLDGESTNLGAMFVFFILANDPQKI
jgi:hypothetical protein